MALPSQIKALILDMDGVLWKSNTPIGDLPHIFSLIKSRNMKFCFATNNGTLTPDQYARRLVSFGVHTDPDQIVTSSLCVADLLSRKLPKGATVFAIGETGLFRALEDKQIIPLPVKAAEKAEAVVVGLDRLVTFEKMRAATLLVRRGMPFYATNPDKTFPTPDGEIPGAGAWVSVVTTATGIEPVYAGKPSRYLIDLALKYLGTENKVTLVVGDRLETDIVAGQLVGCPCALVLSGVTGHDQAKSWTPAIDFIAADLETLIC